MKVCLIRLEDFRNYAFQELSLQSGVHVFEGGNAQGKTALLEAVYLGGTARSFRTHREADLIRWGCSQGGLHLDLERDSGKLRQLNMRWCGQPVQRSIRLQDQVVRKLSEFLRELPLALFTPDDLEVVQGGPEMRRGYLDLLLCKLYPQYLESLGRYHKVMRQKSALLKAGLFQPVELDSWDALVVKFGSLVVEFRQQLCAQLGPMIRRLYAELSGESVELRVEYQPNCRAQELALALHRSRGEELRRRTCLVGPHRDELEMSLGSARVRRFGSQGQRRTLALAMRLAQAEIFLEIGKERPVVLLDDCFSELDRQRQARLLDWSSRASQVLITSATPLLMTQPHSYYRVHQGQVVPC